MATNSEVTVFCDKVDDYSEDYRDSSVHVKRCWKKGLSYPLQIWINVLRSDINIIHVQHEYFLYGGLVSALLFPFMLFLLNIRAPVIVTLHGVVSKYNLERLSEINNDLINLIRLYILKINLLQINFFSKGIIVHDKFIKHTLINEYHINSDKVQIIPHGIERMQAQDDLISKKLLNLSNRKVLLFFGYLMKRKGLEILIDAFKKIQYKKPEVVLVIGSGENPRLKTDPAYRKYYNDIKSKADDVPNIWFMGFIPEIDLKTFISAADIIVFPYSVPLASSGALHMALGFNKIVLCSNILTFDELLRFEPLKFEVDNVDDLARKILLLLESPKSSLISLKDQLEHIRENQSWKVVAFASLKYYSKIIEQTVKSN